MEEADLFYIHRGCFLIPKNNNFKNGKNNLIFLYSIHENGKGNIYKPIAIIEFKNSNERYNVINSLIQLSKENNIIQNSKILENKYGSTCYIIKYDNNNDVNSSNMNSSMNSQFNIINNSSLINPQILNKNEENKIDFYLMLAIQLKKEKNYLKKIFAQKFVPNSQIQNEYYLINKNYMNELNQIFNDINQIIDNCSEENEENLLQIIKSNLNKNIIKRINKLNKEKIQKQLDNNEISVLKYSYANNEEKKALCFYQNIDIISKKMLDIMKRIDVNIQNKIIKVNCIFDNNKIIMLLEEDLINIYFYYITDETIVQYLIISKEAESLFKFLLIKGYDFFDKNYLPYNKVKIPVQYDTMDVIIYKLIKGNKIKFRISDKLKTLLLMAFSQNKLYDNYLHDIYLINPDWLNQYKYKKIKKLINDNYQKIENININYTKLNSVFEIVKYINQLDLLEINDKLVLINPNPEIIFDCIPQKLKLTNKYLELFKELVIVDKQIINQIEKNFGLNPIKTNISFVYKNGEGCIIAIKEYPLKNNNQNLIKNIVVFGNFNNSHVNKFDIKYIFEYDNINIMEVELTYIANNNINKYLKEKTYFDKNNKYNNYISPIISNNNYIGNCYLYIDHSKYLNNKKLTNSMYLYSNELYIKSKKLTKNNEDKEFYIVKSKYIIDLEQENNYNEFKNILKGKITKIPINKQDKLDIIYNLSHHDLKQIDDMDNSHLDENQKEQDFYEVDIMPIYNPIDSSEVFMFFNNFTLIEKNCANALLKNIDKIPYNTLICSFVGNNLVIFHYPQNKLNNKNYICIISKIDDKNNLKNEYLLKYKDKKSYEYHMDKIKKNLNGYLEHIQFYNNICPIISNEYIELGSIIKLFDNKSNSFYKNVEIIDEYFLTKEGEKIIAVNFLSMGYDEIAHYNLICKENDLFLTLEKRIYIDFPKFKNKAVFMRDTKPIDRNKTLKENGIKNNSLVTIFINEI